MTVPNVPAVASRIVAINGQPLFRWALKQLVADAKDIEFAGEASTVREGLELIERIRPQLVIVGLDYSDGTGFGLIRDLRVRHPKLPTLMYATQEGTAYAEHCLGLGANGYVSSSQTTSEVLEAIHEVLAGRLYIRSDRHNLILSRLLESGRDAAKPLTDRLSASEFEVFHLVGVGLSNQEIASKLHRSIKTVETYRARVKEKLGVGNNVELAQFALRCLNSMDDPTAETRNGNAASMSSATAPASPLDAAATATSDSASSETAARNSAPKRVLIVDDHSISREPLAIILRQNGFKTDSARDGQEAIDKLTETDHDIVLLDLLMPQINGIRVLEFIREVPKYRKMPVIVMTGLTGGELLDRAKSLGATIVLKAEVEIDALITLISRMVYGEQAEVREAC